MDRLRIGEDLRKGPQVVPILFFLVRGLEFLLTLAASTHNRLVIGAAIVLLAKGQLVEVEVFEEEVQCVTVAISKTFEPGTAIFVVRGNKHIMPFPFHVGQLQAHSHRRSGLSRLLFIIRAGTVVAAARVGLIFRAAVVLV